MSKTKQKQENIQLEQKEKQEPQKEEQNRAVQENEDGLVQNVQKPQISTATEQSLRLNGGEIKLSIDLSFLKNTHPKFSVGDTLRVHFRIHEGDKERTQIYEGLVISIRGEGTGRSFIVRRITHEVGVERIFPYYSPSIQKIEVIRRGKVRRARLYYLRGKSGKEGRIKEVFDHVAQTSSAKKAKTSTKKAKTTVAGVAKKVSGTVKKAAKKTSKTAKKAKAAKK